MVVKEDASVVSFEVGVLEREVDMMNKKSQE